MPMYEIVRLLTAIAGMAMICGGIWLLNVGVIRLHEAVPTSGQDSTSVHLGKEINFKTTNPAIAIFLIGGLLFTLAIMAPEKVSAETMSVVQIEGTLDDYFQPATVRVESQYAEFPVDSNGQFLESFNVGTIVYRVRVSKPGYEDYITSYSSSDLSSGKITVDRIVLKRINKTGAIVGDYVFGWNFKKPVTQQGIL